MNQFTVLVKEPHTKTLIEIVCPDEKAMDKLAKQMEADGCKGVMAVMVMR